jgi:hypothetical protein
LIVIGAILLAALVWKLSGSLSAPGTKVTTKNRETQLTINGQPFTLELAVTPEAREQGLSGRASLALDHGVLFVFNEPDRYSFWMKGMSFPIDILWINRGKVVELVKDFPAPKSGELPAIHTPSVQADRVLEINAGLSDRLNLKVGSLIPDLP